MKKQMSYGLKVLLLALITSHMVSADAEIDRSSLPQDHEHAKNYQNELLSNLEALGDSLLDSATIQDNPLLKASLQDLVNINKHVSNICCALDPLNASLNFIRDLIRIINTKIDIIINEINNISVSACDLTPVISLIDVVINIDNSILNAVESCCAQENSKLDLIINIANSVFNAELSCCSQLNSKLDTITNIDNSILNTELSCCAQLNSKLDAITNINNSILNAELSCCSQLNSKLDTITNIDNSILNTELSCCAQLNSKLDAITNINNSILNAELSCCSQLNSKLDTITNIDNSILNAELSCCAQLNSKLDKIINIDNSVLNAEIACCSQLNSVIGSLTDPGSCLPSVITIPAGINALNLDVIALLKTVLLQFYGPC